LTKYGHEVPGVGRSGVNKSNHRHCRLLRACDERPSSSRAAEERDELAPM
jgi:hypothetical protein